METVLLFAIGAIGYSGMEILWRGYTHWSMALTGGACFLLLYRMTGLLREVPFLVQCGIGAAMITVIEFLVGSVVNLMLHLEVWDYSAQPFNLYGQVCAFYTLMWFLLCIPIIPFCRLLRGILQ